MCVCLYFRPEADVTVAKHAMLQHQSRVMTSLGDGDCYQRIHVRRSHLVIDIMKAFSKATFDVSKILKVILWASLVLMKVDLAENFSSWH